MKSTYDALAPVAKKLRLSALLNHAAELDKSLETATMAHVDWLAILLKSEAERRAQKALKRRLQEARLRYVDACVSRIDWSEERHLNRLLISSLATCDWIRDHRNCIITGATGCGKTWLADALAHAACLAGFTVRSYCVNQLISEYKRFTAETDSPVREEYLSELKKIDLLLLDDWGINSMDQASRFSLYEIIENQLKHGSVLIVSVLPVSAWFEAVGEPTLADSILDRVVPTSYRIELEGGSMRSKEMYGGVPIQKK